MMVKAYTGILKRILVAYRGCLSVASYLPSLLVIIYLPHIVRENNHDAQLHYMCFYEVSS